MSSMFSSDVVRSGSLVVVVVAPASVASAIAAGATHTAMFTLACFVSLGSVSVFYFPAFPLLLLLFLLFLSTHRLCWFRMDISFCPSVLVLSTEKP